MIRMRPLRQLFAHGRGGTSTALPLNWPRKYAQTSSFATDGGQGAAAQKQISPHILFYRQHGRALAKVFLMSFLAYQGIYWGWMKLETLELKEERGKEIGQLEGEVRAAQEAAKVRDPNQPKR